ncbi:MAG TPA: Asp-tRNA(Asn)/Glu-tRNA(Gln) amidotransferase subunit GatA [Candidatus Saccharimonadales bacterium]|nr:Asp-tRNA(Asn)/Glu-tRNA(Gln) amidotransferase subunit GatA [Candidatus Saccharimonadales bacterium]
MTNLDRPIEELAAAVKSGQISAVSLTQESLAAIKSADNYHAVLALNSQALERAQAIDAAIKLGKPVGRLAGIPYIAKDNFLTLGIHTTAASNILKNFEAPYQATVINKLEAEGAILVAKSNLDAFGHGASTENSDFGPTKNPWDEHLAPGGSSGGSAAAIALGLASFTLGTDTGGSIRQPASFCGVVGLKPTYGLVSRNGVIAMGSSFDCIGPITRNVGDAAFVLDVISGLDPQDSTTIEKDSAGYTDTQSPGKGKLALVKELYDQADPDIQAVITETITKLKSSGYSVDEVSLPSVDLALACYYILVPAEISSNLERYDGVKFGFSDASAKTLDETYRLSRDQGFGAEAKRRILIGTYVLSSGYYEAYYRQAQKVRTLIIQEFDQLFQKFDALIGLTAPSAAFALGSHKNPLAMYLEDAMTVPASLAGLPAISLPAGLDQNLPIGLQLIGPQKGERQLLDLAMEVEGLIDFKAKPGVRV